MKILGTFLCWDVLSAFSIKELKFNFLKKTIYILSKTIDLFLINFITTERNNNFFALEAMNIIAIVNNHKY